MAQLKASQYRMRVHEAGYLYTSGVLQCGKLVSLLLLGPAIRARLSLGRLFQSQYFDGFFHLFLRTTYGQEAVNRLYATGDFLTTFNTSLTALVPNGSHFFVTGMQCLYQMPT